MKTGSLLFSVALLAVSLSGFAQQSTPWSHYMWGGIKRNVFSMGREEISAVNPAPGYNLNWIKPDARTTTSFAFGIRSFKPMSKRWTFSNTIGLDMQQLSVVTGMKKYFTNGTSTSYKTYEIQELHPRLKLNAGFDFALVQKENTALSLGASAGQMLRFSKEGYSYSFVEGNLSFSKKQYKLFLSGSFSPYNVSIPGNEEFYGDIDAENVSGSIAYRIVDITAGIAIKLK